MVSYRICFICCTFGTIIAEEHDECVVKLALLFELVKDLPDVDVHRLIKR